MDWGNDFHLVVRGLLTLCVCPNFYRRCWFALLAVIIQASWYLALPMDAESFVRSALPMLDWLWRLDME
jgi:hypothetical protein